METDNLSHQNIPSANAPRDQKVVAIVSGGLDSITMLYLLKDQGNEVLALSVDYGQRHSKELEFAKWHCDQLGIEHQIADLRGITHLLAGSSQTSSEIAVPEGHYAEESMKQTVVPNRNMIMLAVAAGWAISRKFDYVAFGAHSGDHAIYPDCRPEFRTALGVALRQADWHQVKLIAPFLDTDKEGIAIIATKLGVDETRTWSCYKGGEIHCGKCGTCVERIEAFTLAGIPDHTEYESDVRN